jgi:hypothetical protein
MYYLEILTNEVILGNGEVSASNAGSGMVRGSRRSRGKLMEPMHPAREQMSGLVTVQKAAALIRKERINSWQLIRLKFRPGNLGLRTCDKAAPAMPVMLHLRSRYVSKAAILTVPVPSVSAGNRSPA